MRHALRRAVPGLALAITLGGIALGAAPAQAQLKPGYAVLGEDFVHVDLGVAYEDGEFDPHIHLDPNPDPARFQDEYAPDEALLHANSSCFVASSPADLSFLGVNAGESLWLLPANTPSGALYLGVGTEEIAGGFVGDLTFTLSDFSGPGNFAAWQNGVFGEPNVKLQAGSNGTISTGSFTFPTGTHDHFNWGFTEAGIYELTFQVSGTHAQDGFVQSAPVTYTFGIGTTQAASAAVPEAGTLTLLGGSGLLPLIGMALRRRQTKSN